MSFEIPIPRAPTQHGTAVLAPSWQQLLGRYADHCDPARRRRATNNDLIGARRADARSELLQLGLDHTSRYRPDTVIDRAAPIVMTGHQPYWFHPGVWVKQFVLDRIARHVGATAVNVLIDNDLCRADHVSVPILDAGTPGLRDIPLDDRSDALPFEEQRFVNRQTIATFSDRLRHASSGELGHDLLAERLIPLALQSIERAAETSRLGLALAESRHQVEREWGLRTIEVPLSHLCAGRSFATFACELIGRRRRIGNNLQRGACSFSTRS